MQSLNKKILSYFVCILLIYAAGIFLGYVYRSNTILIFIVSSIAVSILFYILARRLAEENTKRWEKTKESLLMEREKLRTHLQFSTRGRAVFSPHRKEISSNELFIQLLNMMSDEKVKHSTVLFDLPEVGEIIEFLDNKQTDGTKETDSIEIRLTKNDLHFVINCVIFPDKSFEITIEDVTKEEEQSILKYQDNL